MSENLDHLREEITRHQTRCRCGHLLAACADCCGWLVDHSPRIEASWRWYVNASLAGGWQPAAVKVVDEVEAYYIAYHESQR